MTTENINLTLTKLFLQVLKDTWKKKMKAKFSIIQVESNPNMIQAIAPQEQVLVLAFCGEMDDVRGCITVCIPTGELLGVLAN